MKRTLLIGAVGAAIVATGVGVALAAPTTIKITIPAAPMKERVIEFRDRFQQDYLDSATDLPVYTLIYRAAANPNDIVIQKRIATRPDGSPRVVAFTSDKTGLVSDGNAVANAVFSVVAQGRKSNVNLDIPAHVQSTIELKKDDAGKVRSIRFQLASPIAVHPNDVVAAPKLPETVYLRAVTIDDASFSYEFGNRESSPSMIYVMILDLNAKGDSK